MLTANLGNTDVATVTNGGALQNPGGFPSQKNSYLKYKKFKSKLNDYFGKLPKMMKSKIIIDKSEVNHSPTQGQKEAGNYKKAHTRIHGLDITIENPKGSFRSGIDSKGIKWKSKMYSHYGYIKGTTGNDGDHVDCFIGPNSKSEIVFVINQMNPSSGEFDEHKVMIGYNTEDEAENAYLENYQNGWEGLGELIPMTIDQFKKWLSDSDTTKRVKKFFHKSASVAGVGEVHTWSDGSKHRKTATGWVLVSEGKQAGESSPQQNEQVKKDEKSGSGNSTKTYEQKAAEALGRWKEFESQAKERARSRIQNTPPDKRKDMWNVENATSGDIVRIERPLEGRVNRGHIAKVLEKVEDHIKVMLPSGSVFLFLAADLAFAKSKSASNPINDGTHLIYFLKGKKGAIGEIRTWADGNRYKKVSENAWQQLPGGSDLKAAHQADLNEYTKKTGGNRSEHRAAVEKAMQNSTPIPVKVLREYPSLLDKYPDYKARVLAIDAVYAKKKTAKPKEKLQESELLNQNPAVEAIRSLKQNKSENQKTKKENQVERLTETLRTLNFGQTPKGFPTATFKKLWNLDSKLAELKAKVQNLKRKSIPQSIKKVGMDKERKQFAINKNKKLKEFQHKIGDLLRKGRAEKKSALESLDSGLKTGQNLANAAINSLKALKRGELPEKQLSSAIEAVASIKSNSLMKSKIEVAKAEAMMENPPEIIPRKGVWNDSVAGLSNETWETYFSSNPSGGGEPNPERRKLHDKIMESYLSRVQPVAQDETPTVIMMMGGTASGKSSMVNSIGFDKTKFVNADADSVKERIPEYRVAVRDRVRSAAMMAHEESSYLVKKIRAQAIAERKNLVIDGTGAKAKSYIDIIPELRKQDYHIQLLFADCPVEVAIPRAIERAEKVGRYVPENFIVDSYPKIPDSFSNVSHLVDEFHVFDTGNSKLGEKPKILYSKKDGHVQEHDSEWVKRNIQ